MKRGLGILGLVAIAAAVLWTPAFAVNSLVVESKTVAKNSTGATVGVYMENDVDLVGVLLALEIRTLEGGAYPTSNVTFTHQGRVAASGLLGFLTQLTFPAASGTNTCSGPTSNTYASAQTGAPDGTSPDGFFWNGLDVSGNPLLAGSDGGTPSFLFTMDIGALEGKFEIDTCCTTPANHTVFIDGAFNQPTPAFTKGVITVNLNAVQQTSGGGPLPTTFDVKQNYPNPFNASTIIPFEVAYAGDVKIEVYDILGRSVATVVDGHFEPGRYAADWNGTNRRGETVATGVYFYRFTSEEVVKTRKMVLLK